jgi:hypothetical protein
MFQQLFRPAPGFGRAETPLANVFLGSVGASPGGGVHGVCGRNAARAALATDGARLAPPATHSRRATSTDALRLPPAADASTTHLLAASAINRS